jgi:hypothetical protein
VADEEDDQDKETEREDAAAKEGGEAEAKRGTRRNGEAAWQKLGEENAGDGAGENAQAGFARLGWWHGGRLLELTL